MSTEKQLCKSDVLTELADTSDFFAQSIMDASPDCIKVIECDGSLSYMNPKGQCAMEIDDFQALAGCEWSGLWPSESKPIVEQAVKRAVQGKTSEFEAFCPTAKGAPKWWHVIVSPILSTEGEPVRVLSISRNITDIIERDNRMKSINTRIRNLNTELDALREENQVLRNSKL